MFTYLLHFIPPPPTDVGVPLVYYTLLKFAVFSYILLFHLSLNPFMGVGIPLVHIPALYGVTPTPVVPSPHPQGVGIPFVHIPALHGVTPTPATPPPPHPQGVGIPLVHIPALYGATPTPATPPPIPKVLVYPWFTFLHFMVLPQLLLPPHPQGVGIPLVHIPALYGATPTPATPPPPHPQGVGIPLVHIPALYGATPTPANPPPPHPQGVGIPLVHIPALYGATPTPATPPPPSPRCWYTLGSHSCTLWCYPNSCYPPPIPRVLAYPSYTFLHFMVLPQLLLPCDAAQDECISGI